LNAASKNTCDLEIFTYKGNASFSNAFYIKDEKGIDVKHSVSRGISKKALSEKGLD
jgi:hypothetical protein